ncbi:membrane steroid-binding protein 1-like [Miscanthus floridulus]|uniref:membrane steroid-binding protein 1-like n=1 Tax=Miscanthus floridulus TaxID=154761 RepID=UPI00345A4C98
MAVAELWETLKQAIVTYTGLSPAAFFTAVAVAAVLYHVVSGLFAAPPPPPPRPREEPEAEPLPPPVQMGEVSEEELRQYDGSDPKKPLLMAIKGQIYDVTQSRMFYGPGGPYALFAGKDASRALAKMSFEPQDLTGDISGLGPFELDALQDWEYKFMSKYVKVGTVKKTVPVEEGSTASTAPETSEATTEAEKAPATEEKPREVSSEAVKVKEAPADEGAQEN